MQPAAEPDLQGECHGGGRSAVALDPPPRPRPKFDFCRSLPTLRHIAFAYQGQTRVEHWRRTPEGWVLDELRRPSDRLDAMYRDAPVLRTVDSAEAIEDAPPASIP